MGTFKYEKDLLKHFIRTDGWLPLCKQRRRLIRAKKTPKNIRELRYFTFCAIGAIDVLMLDVHKVITPSERGFESVFFFDKDRESVLETQSRIPGATGFVGNFVKLVTSEDFEDPGDEDDDPAEQPDAGANDPLRSPEGELNTKEVREKALQQEERRRFASCFPFDVINLDLEEYVFKPSEELPGKLLKALRKVLRWQQRPVRISSKRKTQLDGFSLMFTTKIGPDNLPDDYLARLQNSLATNLRRDEHLAPVLLGRAGTTDIAALRQDNFEVFFKLAVPKVLVNTLMSEDWYVEPEKGIKIYEFQRDFDGGNYKMLHMVMDIRRHDPPRGKRLDGETSAVAAAAYQEVVRHLFANAEIIVSDNTIDVPALTESLNEVIERGQKYSGDI
jgi:hypothetical protein